MSVPKYVPIPPVDVDTFSWICENFDLLVAPEVKFRELPKSLASILWGPWVSQIMTVPFMTIHKKVISLKNKNVKLLVAGIIKVVYIRDVSVWTKGVNQPTDKLIPRWQHLLLPPTQRWLHASLLKHVSALTPLSVGQTQSSDCLLVWRSLKASLTVKGLPTYCVWAWGWGECVCFLEAGCVFIQDVFRVIYHSHRVVQLWSVVPLLRSAIRDK